MTANLDFDRQVTAWLDAAWPSDVAPEVVDAALHEARSMRRPSAVVRRATGPSSWPPVGELWILGRRRSLARVARAMLLAAALVAGALYAGSRLPRMPKSLMPDGALTPAGLVPVGIVTLDYGAAALPDGRVIVQGEDTALAVWDDASRSFDEVGQSNVWRGQSHLLPLADGRVAIVGGDIRRIDSHSGEATGSTLELFDPVLGRSSPSVEMQAPRWAIGAVLLDGGAILAAGGITLPPDDQASDAIERYDPATARWSEAGRLARPRINPSMAKLPAGRVLIVGGDEDTDDPVAELYDVAAGNIVALVHLAAPHAFAEILPDGRLLLGGGGCSEVEGPDGTGHSQGNRPKPTEIFDPATVRLSAGPSIPHCAMSLTPLAGGEIYLAGWWYDRGTVAEMPGEPPPNQLVTWGGLLDPVTGTTRETQPPPGKYVRVVALPDGRALVLSTAEQASGSSLDGQIAQLLD